jgi:hypothetical protein
MAKKDKIVDNWHFVNSIGIVFLIFVIVILAVGILFDSDWITGKWGLNMKVGGLKYYGKMFGTQTKNQDINCIGAGCINNSQITVGKKLSDEALSALTEALVDEYKAYTTYSLVVDVYGQVQPFDNIAKAEEQHIASIQGLFQKYGKDVFDNPWAGRIAVPQSIKQACKIGVESETYNYRLYESRWLPAVSGYEDIDMVFKNLMNASKSNHLPAFESCD